VRRRWRGSDHRPPKGVGRCPPPSSSAADSSCTWRVGVAGGPRPCTGESVSAPTPPASALVGTRLVRGGLPGGPAPRPGCPTGGCAGSGGAGAASGQPSNPSIPPREAGRRRWEGLSRPQNPPARGAAAWPLKPPGARRRRGRRWLVLLLVLVSLLTPAGSPAGCSRAASMSGPAELTPSVAILVYSPASTAAAATPSPLACCQPLAASRPTSMKSLTSSQILRIR
jgi:hypothetical protein